MIVRWIKAGRQASKQASKGKGQDYSSNRGLFVTIVAVLRRKLRLMVFIFEGLVAYISDIIVA